MSRRATTSTPGSGAMPRKALVLAALAALSGCAWFDRAYYDFTGKMSPEYAKERGVPECAKMTAAQCTKMRRSPEEQRLLDEQRKREQEELEKDRNILLAGAFICQKVSLPLKCFTLLEPATLAARYPEVTPDERVYFEMARNLHAQLAESAAEERRLAEQRVNSAEVAGEIRAQAARQAASADAISSSIDAQTRMQKSQRLFSSDAPKNISCSKTGSTLYCSQY